MTPKLLLLHPGALVGGSPTFEDEPAAYAQSKGFLTIQPDYPTCDPPAAIQSVVMSAAAAASDGSPVYAYGDSAGASLALRLVQKNRVLAGAGYSPVLHWASWVRGHPDTTNLDCLRPFTDAQLDTCSPAMYPSTRPIICISGVGDCMCPNADAVAWDASDLYVWTWQVDGGHLGDTRCLSMDGGPGNAIYDAQMHRAIDWLATRAGLPAVP